MTMQPEAEPGGRPGCFGATDLGEGNAKPTAECRCCNSPRARARVTGKIAAGAELWRGGGGGGGGGRKQT